MIGCYCVVVKTMDSMKCKGRPSKHDQCNNLCTCALAIERLYRRVKLQIKYLSEWIESPTLQVINI